MLEIPTYRREEVGSNLFELEVHLAMLVPLAEDSAKNNKTVMQKGVMKPNSEYDNFEPNFLLRCIYCSLIRTCTETNSDFKKPIPSAEHHKCQSVAKLCSDQKFSLLKYCLSCWIS